MDTTEFIWINGSFLKWQDANVHVLTHTLHYGGGVFEGIRLYKTDRGPAVFRLPEHIKRFFYSGNSLKLEFKYTEKEIVDSIVELVRRNKLEQGYIRPLGYFGYGKMGLKTTGAPTDIALACWPWGSYLPHDSIDIKISKYIRIHPGSTVADAKIVGHYANSILASQELFGTNFHEALFLDYKGDIAEGPGENIFFVKGSTLITPPVGSILPGITRDTVKQICKKFGYTVTEKNLRPEDAFGMDEAFFTGTAAEITPIRSIDGKNIGASAVGPMTKRIKETYLDIVYGRNKEFDDFLTYVNGN